MNPVFFDLAELNREGEIRLATMRQECVSALKTLGPKPDAERRRQIVARFERQGRELLAEQHKRLLEIQARYGQLEYNELAYSYFSPDLQADDDSRGIFEYMHWERHGESLGKTEHSISEGDVDALRRVHRTHEDFFRVTAKKGPIKNFQGDTVHRQLLELLLCFEREPLTKEERADCFDEYCACGEVHDPGALDKQYRRLKKQLQTSLPPPHSPQR